MSIVPERIEKGQGNNLNVLLVTDDADLTKEIGAMLEQLDFEGVDRARNEPEAVRVLKKKKKPDVVIVDLNISGTSGFKVTRAILGERAIPVLLVVEPRDEELAKDDKSSGALAYVVKPLEREALNEAIELAIARFEELSMVREQAKNLKEALEGRKIVEKAKAVLMRRFDISEVEAFQRLKHESSSQQKNLREVSEAVVLADKMF